ncbi:hypothetical protein HC752_11805 [Vibrio sp. S9_S30]|uniref:hypothetical protein n=1 Tax=Vibrio sp. S9_S30 TaxID=2720226 RepID=UPI001680A6A5|nr:hypothetical protein [Vibrio sp. S9_S30]MBD1557616.1 hypothetical protein [Vibrio sp. S9_S30]
MGVACSAFAAMRWQCGLTGLHHTKSDQTKSDQTKPNHAVIDDGGLMISIAEFMPLYWIER